MNLDRTQRHGTSDRRNRPAQSEIVGPNPDDSGANPSGTAGAEHRGVPLPADGPLADGPGLDIHDVEREAAMIALFDSLHGQLVRLAFLLGADHDAEDLVSEAFCELHRRWYRLRDPAAAPQYLRSIVCNLARMHVRHLQVRRRHAGDELPPGQASVVDSAESSVLLREGQRAVVAALRQLPVRQREALVLRYWLDLREADIAGAMGISTGAVKSHIFRGMAALATLMGASR
ncbi:RNA polymerase sigma factor [Micromonospora sp. NPDC005087]|uniref:RNA polymerase sigma factor n=1 Tax=Micromonospora sp. NPDC005087 TaxID=3364225 RepID=UPI0036AD6312